MWKSLGARSAKMVDGVDLTSLNPIFFLRDSVMEWPRDFVLYILPFGLVKLRTFHLAQGLVRCNMSEGVHARAGADVSFRDVTIKIPGRGCNQGYEWRHAPEASAEIFVKSQLFEFCLGEDVFFSLARRGLVSGPHVVWGRWKSQYRKMVSYVENL